MKRRSKKTRRRLLWAALALALVAIEGVYVIAANRFLRGEGFGKLVNYDPQYIYCEYESAWTVFPGFVELRNFRLRGQDPGTRWELTLEKAAVRLNLLALPFRKLHVTNLNGEHPAFRLYLKDAAGKRSGQNQPVIEGFIDNPPDTGSSPPERRFKFQFGDVDLKGLQEIWIDNYRFAGNLDVRASNLFIWPANYLEIGSSVLKLAAGEVKSAGGSAVHGFVGEAEVSVDRYALGSAPDTPFVSRLGGRAKLTGKVDDPFFFNAYMETGFPLRFETLGAAFDIDVAAKHGEFAPESVMKIDVNHIEALAHSSRAEGEGHFEARVQPEGALPAHLAVRLELPQVSATKDKQTYFSARGLVGEIQGPDTSIAHLFKGASYALALDSAHFADLRPANEFLGGTRLRIISGQATVRTKVALDSKWALSDESHFDFMSQKFHATWGRQRWSGDVRIRAQARKQTDSPLRFTIDGTEIVLTNALLGGGPKTTPGPLADDSWNLRLRLLDGTITNADELRIATTLAMDISDTGPVLKLISEQVDFSPVVRTLFTAKNVKFSSKASWTPRQFAFNDIRVDSDSLKFGGYIRRVPPQWDVGMLIDGGLLKLGVTMKNNKLSVGLRKGSVEPPLK